MVGVVAHLSREVEGAGEPRLAGIEQELEALVGRLGIAEARVLAHGPEPPAVHLGVDAPGVGEGARSPELDLGIEVRQIGVAVELLDLDPGVGEALDGGVLVCHEAEG